MKAEPHDHRILCPAGCAPLPDEKGKAFSL